MLRNPKALQNQFRYVEIESIFLTNLRNRPVLLVMDRGRRVEKVHRPQRGHVDGVLRVVHPQAVRDPPGIGGRHVEVRVRVGVDIHVVLPLQPETKSLKIP